jgi:tetratricopeptide (TPR) repeat protein
MQKLNPRDTQHLQAAYACIGSGNHEGARAALDKIAPEFRDHPAVLVTRLSLCEGARQWETCLELVETLIRVLPDNPMNWVQRSQYLRELGRVREAREKLLPAAEKFPTFWMVPYNLACCACRLGDVNEGRARLNTALQLVDADAIKSRALSEPDLEPLWPEIRGL